MEPKTVLAEMIRFASELDGWNAPEMASSQDRYIRIGGLGYRAVSLSHSAPLCKHSNGPVVKLDTIRKQFENPPKLMAVDPDKKQERCLQRYIIKASLTSNRDMLKALSIIDGPYEELIFATDEVSLGDVRCDILAVGKIDGTYYPVVIELKSNRDKSRLIEQLENFCVAITKYGVEFKKLLTLMTDRKELQIDTDKPRKIIIWPVADSESKKDGKGFKSSVNAEVTRVNIVKEKISLIEYDEFENSKNTAIFYKTWDKYK